MTRDELVGDLLSMVCVVEFNKVDETSRRMECTLIPSFLPETNNSGPSEIDPETQTVWDVESNGFRKFKLQNVTSVNGVQVDGITQ